MSAHKRGLIGATVGGVLWAVFVATTWFDFNIDQEFIRRFVFPAFWLLLVGMWGYVVGRGAK